MSHRNDTVHTAKVDSALICSEEPHRAHGNKIGGLFSLVILFSWFLDPSATQPDMLPVRYLVDIAGTSAGCWLSCFTLVSVVI